MTAEPPDSLAGELRRLLPQLRQIAGQGRRVTVCFDRGGWSPALFAGITRAGSGLLTWRKGPAPDIPAAQFTAITCADDRGREHRYDLAGTTVTLGIHDGPRKGQTVTLRQVTRRGGRRLLSRHRPRPALRGQIPPKPWINDLPMSGVLVFREQPITSAMPRWLTPSARSRRIRL